MSRLENFPHKSRIPARSRGLPGDIQATFHATAAQLTAQGSSTHVQMERFERQRAGARGRPIGEGAEAECEEPLERRRAPTGAPSRLEWTPYLAVHRLVMPRKIYLRQPIVNSFRRSPSLCVSARNLFKRCEGCSTTWRKLMQMQGKLCIKIVSLQAKNG